MKELFTIGTQLLVEQDSKLSVLRKAITERLPVSIYYKGPPEEVREGQRVDIEPIVLGTNARSGNLVIWAYVFKGISKRGLPGWKMFRVDRINSAKINMNAKPFDLDDLPGYVEGKAPNMMRSLSSVDIYSPYWFEERPEVPQPEPPVAPAPEQPAPEVPAPEQPEMHPSKLASQVYGDLGGFIKNRNGQRFISKAEYDTALQNIYGYQEDQFKNRQRMIGGNERPGEGTRKRFQDTSKFELDKILARDNVKVDNGPEIENPENVRDNMLAESHRIQSRIKRLIKW